MGQNRVCTALRSYSSISPLSEIWAANLVRSPLRSSSVTSPLLAPLPLHRFFARPPAHRSAPAHSIFGPLRSVFRSDPAPLTCSVNCSCTVRQRRVGVYEAFEATCNHWILCQGLDILVDFDPRKCSNFLLSGSPAAVRTLPSEYSKHFLGIQLFHDPRSSHLFLSTDASMFVSNYLMGANFYLASWSYIA